MKRIMMTIVAAWMMITSMNAQRLTNIQAEARFITILWVPALLRIRRRVATPI